MIRNKKERERIHRMIARKKKDYEYFAEIHYSAMTEMNTAKRAMDALDKEIQSLERTGVEDG